METKRLSKALAAAGIASRRACEELIFEGRVKVNGKKVLIPQTMVSWEEDQISVDGNLIRAEEEKQYFILNKPSGYVCTSAKNDKKKIVVSLFHGVSQRLFTVGRLDRQTTGLLIVTNDGHFANKVMHPSYGVDKEYLVKTDKEITAEHLKKISQGMRIEGTFVKPISVYKVRRGTVKVTVKEGKKHEVRCLIGNAGLEVRELTRIRIGRLKLGSLPVGKWRKMTEREKALLFEK